MGGLGLFLLGIHHLQYELIAEDGLDDVGLQQCQPQDPAHYDYYLRLGDLSDREFSRFDKFKRVASTS